MKVMNSYIEIGDLIFRNRVASVSTKASRKEVTSSATIRIPRFSKMLTSDQSEYRIKPGDPVIIKVGYDGELREEWSGYVVTVKPTTPLEIYCEDEMFLLKQKQVSQSWATVTLEQVLRFLVPSATIKCQSITLEPFRLDKVTVAQALSKIKDEYGLDVYFRGKTLYAGLAYNETGLPTLTYHLQKNIPRASDQSDLIFKRKDDVKLKVKAISILPNNSKVETEVGDPDGEQRTLTFYNIKTKAELETVAKEQINHMKYDGYRGTLQTFGWPVPIHGGIASIEDDEYPERKSGVFIESVDMSYDGSGYRHSIELGRSATAVLT